MREQDKYEDRWEVESSRTPDNENYIDNTNQYLEKELIIKHWIEPQIITK